MNFDKYINIAKNLQPCLHPYSPIRTFHVTFGIYKKKTLCLGINNSKTHPNIKKLNYVSEDGEDLRNIARTHSELNCVLKIKNKYPSYLMKDITFVNVRLDKRGNVKYAKPCNGCFHLMEQVGYKKIYFSNDSGNFFELNKT
jgi:hypothetical protein